MTTETDTTNPFANQALLSIAPKIPAALSMVGSYAIIREAVVDLKAPNRLRIPRLSRTLLRTLVALSVADLFYSLPWVLTTQTAPSEIPYLYGNVGNTQTCSAFGAIFQVGFIAEPTFNVLYALFSLLMVRCQWNTLHFNRTEPLAQVSIWLAAFASAIIPIPYNVYNSAGQVCWFNDYPSGCSTYQNGAVDCIRGENYWQFVAPNIFYVAFLIVAGGVLMFLIYRSVRKLESRMARYSATSQAGGGRDDGGGERGRGSFQIRWSALRALAATGQGVAEEEPSGGAVDASEASGQGPSSDAWRRRSRAVREHALLYMFSFLLTYTLSLIVYLIMLAGAQVPPALDFFAFTMLPMQGFFNFYVFCHKRPNMVTCEGRLFRKFLCFLCDRKRQRAVSSSDGSAQPGSGNVNRGSQPPQQHQNPSHPQSGSSPSGLSAEMIEFVASTSIAVGLFPQEEEEGETEPSAPAAAAAAAAEGADDTEPEADYPDIPTTGLYIGC